jgi:hypothetical protein
MIMASPEEEQELAKYLGEVVQSTLDGLIVWKPANPTTFFWDKTDATGKPSSRLSIQQVERNTVAIERGRPVKNKTIQYIFQAFEMLPTGGLLQRLSIDTGELKTLSDLLQNLFERISREKLKREMEFLNSTLPSR